MINHVKNEFLLLFVVHVQFYLYFSLIIYGDFLCKKFNLNQYPEKQDIEEMSKELGVEIGYVKDWFRRRRQLLKTVQRPVADEIKQENKDSTFSTELLNELNEYSKMISSFSEKENQKKVKSLSEKYEIDTKLIYDWIDDKIKADRVAETNKLNDYDDVDDESDESDIDNNAPSSQIIVLNNSQQSNQGENENELQVTTEIEINQSNEINNNNNNENENENENARDKEETRPDIEVKLEKIYHQGKKFDMNLDDTIELLDDDDDNDEDENNETSK